MAGPGCQITIGDGPHFIMVVGILIIIMAGSGFQIPNGVLHGSTGEEQMDIMDGNQWPPGLV